MTDERRTHRGRSRLPRGKKSGDEDPKMIGQWRIGRTIGKGSSGRVKIARHVKTHQYAAIKIVSKKALLHSRMSMTDASAQAEKILLGIEREIVIMKLIDHPNVLSLYDVWETGNELYLIMEYVEGGELFDYLVSRGLLPVDEALHYFQQIISAVSYCHRFNIAHRGEPAWASFFTPMATRIQSAVEYSPPDLKPENLLLSKSGSGRNIKVADFGMAAYNDPSSMLSTSCGSPHYASPEVVEGRFYKGNVSDIWSCGVILYALLVGRLPFDDENLRILLEKVKMATFEIPPDIPLAAQDLISRMLEKDVTRRITMTEILRHPFFRSSSPSPSLLLDAQTPTLDQLSCSIEKPVQSEEEIDADIFDNLRTLWHGAPSEGIIKNLLNDEKTWEKAVYHLLLKYRSKHLENYNMEEEDDDQERPRHNLTESLPAHQPEYALPPMFELESAEGTPEMTEEEPGRMTEDVMHALRQNEAKDPEPTNIARPNAPTPQRAGWRGDATTLKRDPDVFTSTPRHVRMVASPAAPRPPRLSTLDTDTDIFTTIPLRVPTVSSLGPIPLPLPTLPVTDAFDVPTLPVINLQAGTPMGGEQVPTPGDPPSHSPSPSPSPLFDLLSLDIPNLQDVDETVQRFFVQIVEHLNTMQMRQVHSSTASSRSATPDPDSNGARGPTPTPILGAVRATRAARKSIRNEAPPAPSIPHILPSIDCFPDDSRFEDAEEDTQTLQAHTTDPPVPGLGISDRRPCAPRRAPFQQPQQRVRPPPPPGRAYSKQPYGTKVSAGRNGTRDDEKENMSVRKNKAEPNITPARKKSSLRSSDGGRRALGDKHVQIVLPPEDILETKAKKKSILSPRSTETSPALSDDSFFLPAESTPKRSWFGNLFNFKPASYNLLSVHDAYTTREECARVLRALGVAILSTQSEVNGMLKCKLEEIRDPAGVMAVARAVQFRVELHAVSYAHSVSGYVTSLTMVQENGALSSFKLVYNRLRREWDLDTPPSTRTHTTVYGPLSESPAPLR